MFKKISNEKGNRNVFPFSKVCAIALCLQLSHASLSVKAQVDPLEYPPGHPNVTVSTTDQLHAFPLPRYKPGHSLMPNYNVMDPVYFGGRFQPGVSDAQAVANSVAVQTELAKNFNYMVNVTWSAGDQFNNAWINLANANPQWKVALMTLRAQVGGTKMWNQNFPSDHYLQNSSGQYLGWSGNVVSSSNKTWRPTAPVADYTPDGVTVRNWINSALAGLTRNVDLVNEDGEVYPIIETPALQADPVVSSAKAASGLDWQPFLASKVKVNDNAYRDQFMTLPKLANAKYTEYRLDGHRTYQLYWEQTRFMNSQINGQYYSTPDLYVRWPYNWKDWTSAWHGLKWITQSRYYELREGDKLFSPFVAAGWDANPEVDVRPAQWLGLLKIMGMYGSEFYYTGYFNEAPNYNPPNPPPHDPKGYAWQAVMPSYAQAVSSRYEYILRNGSLLAGDMTDNTVSPPVPFYQFSTGATNKVVVIRKEDNANKYAITGAIENNSNQVGSAPLIDDAQISLNGQTLKFKIRRQGSTYIYDNTNSSAPVFYQLDGWHEYSHPYRWTKDFNMEAELYDNINTAYTIKTSVPAGTPAGDYREFTSYLTFPDAQTSFTPIEYSFTPRDASAATYYLWVKLRSRVNGVTTGLTASVDNSNAKTISCVSDTLWKWYRIDNTSQQAISYANLSLTNHTLRLTPSNSKLEIDQIVLTTNPALGLVPAGPACSTNNCNATVTPNGPLAFCQGGNVVLTASAGSSYLWTPGNETTQSITVTSTGSYSVTVMQSNGCSDASAPLTVSVSQPPAASVTPNGPLTFCQGGNVSLAASPGSSYLWIPGGETTSSITVSAPGSYAVTITNAAGCSATSSAVQVTVNSLPAAAISPAGPITINQGDSVTLTSTPGSSYMWMPSGETSQSITVTDAGIYSVTVTNASGCTAVSPPVTVTVNGGSQGVAFITPGGPTAFCQGGSVVLMANTGLSYLWSTGETAQSITANTSGSYTVTVTFASNTSTSLPVTVTVNPLPAAVISANGPTSFCIGDNVVLTASPASSYLWLPGNETTQSITVDSTGVYTVSVTDNNGCIAVSLPETVVTANCGSCPVPNGLSESNISDSSATLNWNAVAGADSLQVFILKVFGWSANLMDPISGAATQTIADVEPGNWYIWRIRSLCGGTFTGWSPYSFFTTPSARIASPPGAEQSFKDLNSKATDRVSPGNGAGDAGGINIFPNPASDAATVWYGANHDGTVNLRLIDFTGKEMMNKNYSLSEGANSFPMDLKDLAKGVYIVILNDNGKVNSGKLIVH